MEKPYIAKSEPDGYSKIERQEGRTTAARSKRFTFIYIIHDIISKAPFQTLVIRHATNSEKAAIRFCENFGGSLSYVKTRLFKN